MVGENTADDLLLEVAFARDEVTRLRHRVGELCRTAGLVGDRLEDFVLAAYELLTNAVRHGGGNGRLRLWRGPRPDLLNVEVTDDGGGFSAGCDELGVKPDLPSPGGLGLFLAERLTDLIEITTGPTGTTVRIVITTESEQAGASQPVSLR